MSKSPLYSSLIISSPSRRRSTQYQYLLRLNTYMCSLFFFFYIYLSYTLRWINASMWVPLKKIYERTVYKQNFSMKSYFDELWKNKVKLLLKEFMNFFLKEGKKKTYSMGNWISGKFKLSFPFHYDYAYIWEKKTI